MKKIKNYVITTIDLVNDVIEFSLSNKFGLNLNQHIPYTIFNYEQFNSQIQITKVNFYSILMKIFIYAN